MGTGAGTVHAEDLQILAQVGLQMGENMQALTGYTFQQRTAVQINGELKNVKLVQVAFGPDRQPLITTLSSEPPEELRGGPLMRHIEEDKTKEMKGDDRAGCPALQQLLDVESAESAAARPDGPGLDEPGRSQHPGDGIGFPAAR